MNISSLPLRLRLMGDAFALSAFVLPLLCLASGAFYFTLGRLPANADWNIVLATGAMTAIAGCGLVGLVFALMGRFHQQKRLFWQGAFGIGISAALSATGWMVAFYIGALS